MASIGIGRVMATGRPSLRLAILTPAPDEPRFAALADRWFERLAEPLRAEGVEPAPRSWTEADDLGDFDAVAPLLAWSYHARAAQWDGLLDRLGRARARTVNPLDTLAWNTRKTYLGGLEQAGAPVIPTLFADRLDAGLIDQAHGRFGAELVAKPQISGGSFETVRLSAGRPAPTLPRGPAMVQPFMPSVSGEGELSLVYFDRCFSHAVAKIAKADDFRVQYQHGGLTSALHPPPEAFVAAERVLAATSRTLIYARIDLIRDPDGRLRLMELEAIEPDLFLEHAPDGGAAFARATRRALAD